MADQEPTDEVLQFILDLKAENLNFKRTLDRMDKKLQECMDKGVDAAAINSIRMMVNNIHTPVTDVYDGTDSLEARAYRDLETYDQLSEDEKTTGQMWKATRRMIKGRKSGSRLLAAKKSTNKSTVGAATPATSAAPRRMQATASSQQNARPQQEQSAAAAPAAPSSHEKPGLQQGQSTASAPAASSHQQTGPQQRQSDPAGPTEAVATSSQEAPDEIMVDCPNCGKSLTLVMYLEEKEIWEGGEPWEEDELLEEGEPLEEDEEDEDDEDYEPPKSFSSGLAW